MYPLTYYVYLTRISAQNILSHFCNTFSHQQEGDKELRHYFKLMLRNVLSRLSMKEARISY